MLNLFQHLSESKETLKRVQGDDGGGKAEIHI